MANRGFDCRHAFTFGIHGATNPQQPPQPWKPGHCVTTAYHQQVDEDGVHPLVMGAVEEVDMAIIRAIAHS